MTLRHGVFFLLFSVMWVKIPVRNSIKQSLILPLLLRKVKILQGEDVCSVGPLSREFLLTGVCGGDSLELGARFGFRLAKRLCRLCCGLSFRINEFAGISNTKDCVYHFLTCPYLANNI